MVVRTPLIIWERPAPNDSCLTAETELVHGFIQNLEATTATVLVLSLTSQRGNC